MFILRGFRPFNPLFSFSKKPIGYNTSMNFLKRLFKTKNTTTNTLTITSANGFHLRPIAQFVNEAKKYNATITLLAHNQEVSATQVPKILSLSLEKGDSFELKCKGKEAQKASQALSSLFKRLMHDDKVEEKILQEEATYESPLIKGESLSKGISLAPLVLANIIETNGNSAICLSSAIDFSIQELESLYEENKNQPNVEIFLAQQQLLESELFLSFKDESIDEFKKTIQIEIEKLKGSKFESRIADYLDVQQRVLKHMGYSRELQLPLFPYILVAKELLPSDIEKLIKTPIKGVILQSGTTTSHTAILLRSAAIPSLIIHEKIELSKNAILDANSGSLILNPSQNDLKKAIKRQKEFLETLKIGFNKRFEKSITTTGININILANITDLNSAKEAKGLGANGIGLLRTEFLFTQHKPTIQEQQNAYQEIFNLFNEVTVRTLDIGGDKSLPYINIEKEENPFLGIRGIRFSLQEETLFKEQLLAIGLASANAKETKVKIMFPMVSRPQEFTKAKEIALEIYKEHHISLKQIEFGIMLEVPSVIFALRAFDQLVDFYSIGSNDLTQYLFATERTHPTLSVKIDSPILFSALKYIKEQTDKPISICGEIASLEVASKQLIELGYQTLSVSTKLIPHLKEHIRQL